MSQFIVDYPEVPYPGFEAAPPSYEDGQYSAGEQVVYYQCEYPTEQYQEETTPQNTEESQPQRQTSREEQDDYRDRERDRDRTYRRPRDGRYSIDRRDYDRDRSKDRDYDRQRSRERDSDRSRGRSRDSERRRDSGRDRSSHDDINEDSGFGVDDGSRSDSGDEYEHSSQRRRYTSESHLGGDRWIREEPSNTIVLRGLNSLITEKDIYAALEDVLDTVKEVRLMRRSKGSSRGFAFAEFKSVEEAQRWKDQKQGVVMLKNEYPVYMNFSITRSNSDLSTYNRTDWICSKCGAHNFKRRNCCYKCYLSREESDMARDGDGHDQIGLNPCNTLIFRGLDALTTEETLLKAISSATPLTVKNIKVIRDDLTKSSRGFGFAELNSVSDSTQILEALTNMAPAFEVDGKVIMVNYAKNTFSTVMLTLPVSSAAAAQGYEFDEAYQNYNAQGGYVDASGQYYDYSAYYSQQYSAQQAALQATTAPGETDTQANATNAAAAVAQAAIQQANAVKKYRKQTKKDQAVKEEETVYAQPAEDWAQGAPLSVADGTGTDHEYPQYPTPDVASFQFEASSGYYYDATTGLYYDANSQYFYNSTTGQFLYWCAEKMTYLPAPTGDDESQRADKGEGKEKDKKEKVKIAKKIAKDMEKWAKTLNSIKDGSSKKSSQLSGAMLKESATADAGFAVLEKAGKRPSEDLKLMPPPPPLWDAAGTTVPTPAPPSKAKPGLVAYGEDSDSDDDDQAAVAMATVTDETKLIDWNKLTCLLCKRQFQNRETLTKHQQMSDLHKQNLEVLKASKSAVNDGSKFEYRDRAKERRQKYGTSAPPIKSRRHKPHPEPEIIYEQPTKEGITNDNIGNKLLQKMGWAAGQGLGKKGQGIVKPIEAQRRVLSAGLGAKGGNIVAGAADSYKEAVKKTMYARYKEME